MSKDDQPSPQGLGALQARFQEQSRKAQAYYAVMHRMRQLAGSDEAASAWMEQALPAFDGKTPAQMVSENRADELLNYIESL
ncbi:MbcA/ParS/Xre antitoxin family protein [Noviherbaspirillum aridicola]|uniref:Antitoxin Xre/MbcA/ParS-like toxin-binding domain-containing protein n=1 Tax=Noviherbaspirillum aridicola TaxID=2849687 RepID=A0ABQ4PZR4_9BURK|nr:MbcA/ParS/Xre antitoxin family protein [Noviherbaspirillum aridicola]GIZ50315.1 hypothetical protein NCCP691_03290 [Noviherbaspirillum aridicola]